MDGSENQEFHIEKTPDYRCTSMMKNSMMSIPCMMMLKTMMVMGRLILRMEVARKKMLITN